MSVPFSDLEGVPAPPIDTDDTPPKPQPHCEVCGNPIEYKGRGRLPRFHKECRPSNDRARTPLSSATTPKVTSGRQSKAEREAAEIAADAQKMLSKASLLVATVEPFDGLALYAGTPELTNQLRGVLETHDALRAEMASWSSGGSVLGLVLALAVIVLPILAHHHVIPETVAGKPVGKLLETLPQAVMKINKASDDAARTMADAVQQMREQANRPATDQMPADDGTRVAA